MSKIFGRAETGNWAIWLANQQYAGHITEAENLERLEELMAWDKGGPLPDWMVGDKAPREGGIFKNVPKPEMNEPMAPPEPEPKQSWTRSQWRTYLRRDKGQD